MGERKPIITFLRDLEEAARHENDRAQTLQIIASGRRLLGDTSILDKADARYAYGFGRVL